MTPAWAVSATAASGEPRMPEDERAERSKDGVRAQRSKSLVRNPLIFR